MKQKTNKRKKWTKNETRYVVQNHDTMSSKEIAKFLGRSTKSVGHQINKLQLSKPLKLWTEEEKQFVRENYLTMTHEEMGRQINRTRASVRIWCSKNSYRQQMLYGIVEHYFDRENHMNVRTRNLIVADGSVRCRGNGYNLRIKLQLRDKWYLTCICNEFISNYSLKYGITKLKGKEYPDVRFDISNKYLVKGLMERWGIEQAKSKNHEFRYTSCAHEFNPSALLGLFEGDGCISAEKNENNERIIHNFNIVSSSKLFLGDIRDELGFGYGGITKKKDSNCWAWQVTKRQEIQHLYNFMYSANHSFYLQRKKDRFKLIMETSLENCYLQQRWEDEEIKFLQENWKEMTSQELAKQLNRTVYGVKTKASRLNLSNKGTL